MKLLIFYIVLAIGVSFLCSILEAVILSISPNYLESLREINPRQFKRLSPLRKNIERPLASILTINTFAHTIGAAGAGGQAQKVFGNEWITIFSIILTVGILLLSEIIPKSIGAMYWKPLSYFAAKILPPMIIITYPLVYISELISRLFTGGSIEKVTQEEIKAIVKTGFRDGVLEESEYKIIKKMMEFKNLKTSDVMTKINDVFSISINLSHEDYSREVINTHFSRLPVFGIDKNDIKGYVLKNELLKVVAKDEKLIINNFLNPMLIVPSYLKTKTLFLRLIERKEHISAIVDDYGRFIGIVTLEDIIEALLGVEIIDEFDIEQ